MTDRNRAEGWKHAKLTGHKNEDLVTDLILSNISVQNELLRCANKSGKIDGIIEGGLCETSVSSILSGSTKAKPDIRLRLNNDESINISLKKSSGGQVYLITLERFVVGFELQYGRKIPNDVKCAMSLFWGTSEKVLSIIEKYAVVEIDYQKRKHRLIKDTMDRYAPELVSAMLNWFKDNIVEIFDFCFVRGLAKNPEDWADVLWYKNLLPGEEDGDTMFKLDELKTKIKSSADTVCYGNRTGGSTILLPFGFVQWHQKQMQFHHSLRDLKSIY